MRILNSTALRAIIITSWPQVLTLLIHPFNMQHVMPFAFQEKRNNVMACLSCLTAIEEIQLGQSMWG